MSVLEVDAVLAVLDGAEPQNEIEAMLIIQMAITHALAMRSAQLMAGSKEIPQARFEWSGPAPAYRDIHHSNRGVGRNCDAAANKKLRSSTSTSIQAAKLSSATSPSPPGSGTSSKTADSPHATNNQRTLAVEAGAPGAVPKPAAGSRASRR